MTPPRSNSAARIKWSGREEIARCQLPQLGREPQRLDVDALVVTVEHRAVVVEADVVAEQAEAVGSGAQAQVEAGVGGADGHERDGPGAVVQLAGHLVEAGPQRRLGRARS